MTEHYNAPAIDARRAVLGRVIELVHGCGDRKWGSRIRAPVSGVQLRVFVVIPAGLEPATYGLGNNETA